LLADILPSLLLKLTAPFFVHLIAYRSLTISRFSNYVEIL